MKNSSKVFIGILIISIIIIGIGYMQKGNSSAQELIKTSYSYNNIKNINLNIDAAKVYVKNSDSGKINVITEGETKDLFTVEKSEKETLNIIQKASKKKYIENIKSNVIIEVPKNVDLESFKSKIRLGNLTVANVNSKNFQSKINGGTTTLSGGHFDDLNFISNGGNVNLNDTNSKKIVANIEAGNFMATNNNSNKVNVSIRAGVIYVHELYSKAVDFRNNLGNLTFINKNKEYKVNDLKINASHGMKDINIGNLAEN